LPLDGIKIDHEFVSSQLKNPDEAILIKAMLSLAQSLNLQVVAEGVETRQQRDFLFERGCGLAQGYYFGAPMAAAEFERWAVDYEARRIRGEGDHLA
jgi:EAL domain-containing protein (putative c-di-GMP-specific phosphodiesterase class I)